MIYRSLLTLLVAASMASPTDAQRLSPTTRLSSVRILTGHTNGVNAVVFSPDGKLIASASSDKTVKIWNVATGSVVRTLPDAGGSGIAFSPDGSRLVTGSASGALAQWDSRLWTVLSQLPLHPNGSSSVAYASPTRPSLLRPGLRKGTPALVLAATLAPGKARLFDATNAAVTPSLIHELDCCSANDDPTDNYTLHIWRVGFSPNAAKVATALDHGVILWDVAAGSPEPVLPFTQPRGFAFAPDGSSLVIVGAASTFHSGVLVKNFSTGSYYAAAVPSYGGYHAVAFSPDGALFALATGSGGPCGPSCTARILLLGIPGNQVQRELLGHQASVRSLAFSPDGSLLASASADKTIRLWRLR